MWMGTIQKTSDLTGHIPPPANTPGASFVSRPSPESLFFPPMSFTPYLEDDSKLIDTMFTVVQNCMLIA